MSEQWRDVVGFEGFYQVSSLGNVFSVLRFDTRGHQRGGHAMKIQPHCGTGYPSVHLRHNGKSYLKYVHDLVLTAFVGPRPMGMEACHADDIRSNSVLSNLRWGTRKENFEDRDRNGRTAKGVRNGGGVKLNDDKVRQIRERYAETRLRTATAKEFGVHKSTIDAILAGRIWTHV
jgi:hypothetical protein